MFGRKTKYVTKCNQIFFGGLSSIGSEIKVQIHANDSFDLWQLDYVL